MSDEISVADFFKIAEQVESPLYPQQRLPLKTLLEDHSAPLAPLAAQIAQPMLNAEEKRRQNLDYDFHYGRFWRVISHAIQQMTSQIDRIVDVVVAISQVPDPTGYLAFMQDINEEWNEFAMGFDLPHPSDPNRGKVRQAWINMNAFNARLSTKGIERLDYRLRSGHVFRIALEETPWEQYHFPEIDERIEDDPDDEDNIALRDELLNDRDVRRLNYWAPAAAAWIKYDGKGIYEMDEPMIGDEYENFKYTNWKGKGFSKERFHYWRERFEWVSKVTALDHDTRKRAAEAVELMKKIEGEE